jgi:tight adherence protein B
MSFFDGFLPAWWDFLTFGMRLPSLLMGLLAWAAVGWFLGPWSEEKFLGTTSGYISWMVEMFDKMFMQVSARTCVIFLLASLLLSTAAALLITAGLPSEPIYHLGRGLVVLVLLIFGFQLPRIVINRMWDQRIAAFEDQLLDALSFMSNGLKSGLSLIQCMDMVREELPAPVSDEFKLVLGEQRLGVPLEDALLNLERRIDTEDVQILVTSINILRQSGGNLSETFDTIGHTIRERQKVQGRIKTLTAQGVAQGVIIVALPFVLGAVLYTMDQELISRMWTTALGWGMLAAMVTLQAIGALLMRKIVQIQV